MRLVPETPWFTLTILKVHGAYMGHDAEDLCKFSAITPTKHKSVIDRLETFLNRYTYATLLVPHKHHATFI